ncbi:MAG TPA: MBL fold metallo-hydrolase [Chloroflexota bacterium]
MFLFRALASGSSGNAYLLRTERVSLLFEAGVRLSVLESHLSTEGVTPHNLAAVLISHEHWDHCRAAGDLTAQFRTPIYANEKVLRATGLHNERAAAVLEVGCPLRFGDVQVTSFRVSHDSVCPVGFLIEIGDRTIAIATDLGNVTPAVEEAVQRADLVVLEANHDTDMLQQSAYPYHLRRRVAGPTGHLSNTQAASALTKYVKHDAVDVWLAHLSKENNTPSLALRTVQRALKSAGLGAVGVGVALRDKPSVRWNGVPRPRQLSLFSGDAI